jgi:hypothetical protein
MVATCAENSYDATIGRGNRSREGEGYGGRLENIPETWGKKTGFICGEN